MMMKSIFFLFLILPSVLKAAVIYSETIHGELSMHVESPTFIGELELGDNIVIGAINENSLFPTPDVFTFTVAEGAILTSFVLQLNSVSGGNHFLALGEGSMLFASLSDLLFASLVSESLNGMNVLPTEADGGNQGAVGYDLPLPAGDYSVWFQETDEAQRVNYEFTFTTQQVPEPTSITLASIAALFLLRRTRVKA